MATIDVAIAASEDDAFEAANGAMTLAGTSIKPDASGEWGGLRFPNLPISQGASVTSAVLLFWAVNTSNDDPDLEIMGCLAGDDGAFTTDANNISARASTTNSVIWTATGIGTGHVACPSLVDVVQELVDQAGWASGNAAVFKLQERAGGASNLAWVTYDGNTERSAVLQVKYTGDGSLTRRHGRMRALRPVHVFRSSRPTPLGMG